jgi:hypothetical protein
MLRPPARILCYQPPDMTDPLGMTQSPPPFAFDIFAEDFGWGADEHSAYQEAPYWSIYPWYQRLTVGRPTMGEVPALPADRE